MEKAFALHDVWCHAPCTLHPASITQVRCFFASVATVTGDCAILAQLGIAAARSSDKSLLKWPEDAGPKGHTTTYLKDCMEIIGNQICYAATSFYILPKNHKIPKAKPKVLWPLQVRQNPMTKWQALKLIATFLPKHHGVTVRAHT